MWRRLVETQLRERYPSMRSFLTSVFGWSAKENAYFPNLNSFKNDDSSFKIKSLAKEIEKLKSEFKIFKQNDKQENRDMENCPPGIYLDTADGVIYHPPRQHILEMFAHLDKILESKIDAEGEDFLRVDSTTSALFAKLDLEELEQKFPYARDCDYDFLVRSRLILFWSCKDIETRYKLMELLAENEYEKCIPWWRTEWLEIYKAELDKIISQIITYPNDSHVRHVLQTHPHLDDATFRYFCLIGKDNKVKTKEEILTLVKEDRDEALSEVKKWYRNSVSLDFSEYDDVFEPSENQSWAEICSKEFLEEPVRRKGR